jgi:DNA-binding NarL/FixJ family response regulator
VTEEVRVLLCDDQTLMRQGLRLLLDGDDGIKIVGEAVDGADGVRLAHSLQPDVVLMDLRMPRLDGVEATKRLRAELPSVRVLVLTTYGDDALVQAALQAGAAGYLLKDAEPADIVAAIQAVRRGGVWLQTPGAAALLGRLAQQGGERGQPGRRDNPAKLTARELDVVRLIARGNDNHQIAAELVISEATVKTHINNIFAKLEVTDRSQVVVYAYRHGLANA